MAPSPVIAGVDLLGADRAPLRFAATVAAVTGAPLYVASVYADAAVADRLVAAQLGEDLPDDPAEALDAIAGELRAEGLAAEPLALGATSVPRGLHLAAEQLGAALLAVGTPTGARPDRLPPGGVGDRLLAGAPCAVAIVPSGHRSETPSTVGVGYVDTAEGREAVRGAHALARRSGARLRVLTVVQPRRWMLGSAGDDEAALADALRTEAAEAAHESVATMLGAPVDVDVAVSDPGDVLVAASAEVDVLVIGSRIYGPPSATVRGSVGRRVAAEGGGPVIVTARDAAVPVEALIGD